MQNKSSKKLIKFIYGFIVITALTYTLGMFAGISQLIRSPKAISVPVELDIELENEGYMQYANTSKLDITFCQVQGVVIYKNNEPNQAPIAWSEILFPITRVTLLLFIILLSTKLMHTSLKQEPFVKTNAYCLEGIGYCLLIMGGLKYIESQVGAALLQDHLVSPYVSSISSSPYQTGKLLGKILTTEIPVGLFILFIAALFKHGIAIREENALTI